MSRIVDEELLSLFNEIKVDYYNKDFQVVKVDTFTYTTENGGYNYKMTHEELNTETGNWTGMEDMLFTQNVLAYLNGIYRRYRGSDRSMIIQNDKELKICCFE